MVELRASGIVLRFLVLTASDSAAQPEVLTALQQCNAKHLVLTEPAESASKIASSLGIEVRVLPFSNDDDDHDDAPPSADVLAQWRRLVRDVFVKPVEYTLKPCIAVQSLSRRSRGALLVAVALIDAGMKSKTAVDLVRNRRDALTSRQIEFLHSYRRHDLFSDGSSCVVV